MVNTIDCLFGVHIIYFIITQYTEPFVLKLSLCLKKHLNASTPPEHPPVRGNFVVVGSHIQRIILATEEIPRASQVVRRSRLIVILKLIARIDFLQLCDYFPVPAPIDYSHAELGLICPKKI